jgi:PAS domain S-box-containing protein
MSNENDRFRMMVEHSQDWFWEFDENANFTYVSPRIRDLLGYEPEELMGLNAFELMTEDEAERVHRHFDPIVKKYLPFNNLININRHKDGHEVLIESSGTPIFDEEGQFRGYRGVDRDITERKLMEENYRIFTSLTSDYVHYCTRSGESNFKVKWIGGAINPISGYRVEEVLTLGCFLPMVHPDDQRRVSDYLQDLVPGDRKTIEFRIVTQKQEIRWVSEKSQCKAGPSEGELILLGAVTDITERKQAEERLRDSEDRFRNIAEMLPEVVFKIDLSGNLRFANREAYEKFGYSAEAFELGLNAFDMIVPEERDLARERIRQRLGGEEVGAKEYTALRKDGSTFTVILNAIPIIKDLETVGIIGIMTDITERKSNEMALLAATEAAEAANKSKGLFLAKVSHEIRTPMTSIIGFSELLEDADLTPEEKRYVEAIQSSACNLSSLLEDILDLSKVDAGELVVKQKDFNLHKLITELVSTQKKQIEFKKLSFNLNIDNDVPELLIGDSLRIRQVLLNLLNNAIKFTEKGEIGIAVEVTEETGHWVMLNIVVRDSGVGIPKHLQNLIFEPFAQAHGDSTHNYGGSGLGLTISRSLADLMGGSIRVESQKGVGSTFHLIIPMQRQNDNKSEKLATEREPLTWNGPPLNILLAEDNPVNRLFIETALEKMGHTVTVAENGRIALDLLKGNNFDVSLMDIQMPLISGVDVLSVIRKRDELSGKHLKVIALTAYSLIGDQEKYLEMGFDGFLSKPFKQKELIDVLAWVVLD